MGATDDEWKPGFPKINDKINGTLKSWRFWAEVLRLFQIVIGLTAIILTITVASKVVGTEPKILGVDAISWVSWGAAISTGFLASFNIDGKANNFWNGWRMLNEAMMRYETQPEFGVKDLIDAYKEAKKIIGGVDIKVGTG